MPLLRYPGSTCYDASSSRYVHAKSHRFARLPQLASCLLQDQYHLSRTHRGRSYLFFLFQNRYKSIICEQDPYFLELVRYIHLNPVRAGAVSTVADLADYPWSGHSVILGNRRFHQDTAAVLGYFGKSAAARATYLQFVCDEKCLCRKLCEG